LAQAQGTSLKSKLLRDQKADVEQTGSGITPIIGVNLSLLDKKLNIGLKYEFATQMEVKNKTTLDFVTDSVPATGTTAARAITMFPDGAKTPADMPAMLSAGVAYKISDKLSVSSSLYYYFDKSVEYGKKLPNADGDLEYVKNDKVIDGNFIDWALGAEYQLTEKLLVSTGYMFGKQDVKQVFQSDMNYSISSHTYCIGGKYSISPKFDVNLGLSWSKYEKGKKHAKFSKNSSEIALETYMKDTFIVGVGVNVKLGK
jgi:long-subunit fatty acid transport protein